MITAGRIVRLAELDRAEVHFSLDGQVCGALAGDTVLTAMLASGHGLRKSEFGPEWRAGFCLMGACQDCWVWQEEGPRMRACSVLVAEGMRLRTTPPENWP
ncbi:(2Fe-2S)-binding protein [Mesorhizobium caraganae]|uniref:(2Fe-2S)-binding protein n=1 Tax=Mesorhizobium caraganae TaxID=483206 RepID=UPI003ECEE7B4